MKQKLSRLMIVTIVLLLTMLLLTACGDGGAEVGETDPGFVYLPEYIGLPEDVDNIEGMTYQNEQLYFYFTGVIGNKEPESPLKPGDAEYYDGMYDVYGPSLCKINLDGTGFEKLSAFVPLAMPDGMSGNTNINSICFDKDGNLWVAESGYMNHTTEAGEWVDDGTIYSIRKLDSTGAELAKMDLTAIAAEHDPDQGAFAIGKMVVDDAGNCYFTDGNINVYVLDAQGQKLVSLKVDNWIQGIVKSIDGKVGVVAYETDALNFKPIDLAAKSWGTAIPLPYDINDIFSGDAEYDFYYRTNSNLLGYNIASKQPTKLVNWINSDIDSDKLGNIMILPDGRVLCVSHNYGMNGNSKSEFIILTKTDSAQIKPKTKLTLATMWMSSELRGAVLQFNKTNQDYRIEVQDYSEFNTKDDYEAGRLKLNTAIISGNVPDLVDVNQMPMQQYVAKGLMEDLYPYIDKDTEVSRDDLVQSVFRSLEINGGLYQVSPSFSVSSVVGATSLVGPDMGWTIDDLMAVREKMPEGNTVFNYLTRDSMLYSMCIFGMDDYVNWETGECHFDSDTFIKMLEFANTFPVEYNWEDEETNSVSEFEKIKSGQVFLSAFNLYDFQEYQTYQAMYGGDITYIGFPRATGIGNAVSVNAGLAMSSKCAHKEAAWEFMRIFLTEKYQKENIWWGLPTNKNIFDLKLADAMKTEEEKAAQQAASNSDMAVSIGGSVMMGDGLEVKIHPMTQPEKDKIMAMVDALDSTVNYDQSMMEIIQEESAAFFAGQKTAAETAGIIQSRVKIYVNEQK